MGRIMQRQEPCQLYQIQLYRPARSTSGASTQLTRIEPADKLHQDLRTVVRNTEQLNIKFK